MFWLLILVLLLATVLFYALERQAFAPASTAASIWLVVALLGAAVGNLQADWVGLLLIATLLTVYGSAACVGQALVLWLHPVSRTQISTTRPRIVLFSYALLVPLSVGAIVAPLLAVDVDELAVASLLAASSDLTNQRYRGDALPWYANALLIAVYLLALMGGWSWWERGKVRLPNRIATASGLFCATAYAVLTTARATLLFALVLFSAALITSRILAQTQGRVRPISIRNVLLSAGAAGAFVVVVFLAGGWFRYSNQDLSFVLGKADAYFGGVTGLSDWLLRYEMPPPSWGSFTFAGVADALGVKAREIGITQEYFIMPSGNPSNLYTSVRWLVEDFGLVGAHIVIGAFGVAAGGAWAYLLRGRQSGARLYAVIMAIVIGSPIWSLLAYNTLIAACLVFLAWSAVAYRTARRVSTRILCP